MSLNIQPESIVPPFVPDLDGSLKAVGAASLYVDQLAEVLRRRAQVMQDMQNALQELVEKLRQAERDRDHKQMALEDAEQRMAALQPEVTAKIESLSTDLAASRRECAELRDQLHHERYGRMGEAKPQPPAD